MQTNMHNDTRYAEQIVNSLISTQNNVPELVDGLAISDLEADAAEFLAELKLLECIGLDVPAFMIEDRIQVPAAVSLVAGIPWLAPFLRSPRFFQDLQAFEWFGIFGRWLADVLAEVDTITQAQARSTFLSQATEFLVTRIGAVRNLGSTYLRKTSTVPLLSLPQRVGGAQVSTPGCNFTVTTNSIGLRVFWSGAYYVSQNYFNHPTTPTTGVLQSGTYIFGVDGGAYGSKIAWDHKAIVSLPGPAASVHLNF